MLNDGGTSRFRWSLTLSREFGAHHNLIEIPRTCSLNHPVEIDMIYAQSMYHVKDTDLAYLAGILDGEGVITIARVRPAPHVKNGNARYFAKVEVQMSDHEPIEHLARLYDRHIMVKKITANMTKQAYRVSWQAKIAAALIEQVVPYLILKRPQALVLLEFQAAMTAGGRVPGRPLTPEQITMREHYFLRMRRLNGPRAKGMRSQAGSAADYPSAA